MVKLDLACGRNKKEGFIGVDIVPLEGVDVVYDLEKLPWPWEDNSVDEIYCSHFIEHVSDLVSFIDEVYRVLKVGSKAVFRAPYYSSIRATQDPTHKHMISETTFAYYNKKWREDNGIAHYPIKADFDFSWVYYMAGDWASRNQEARDFAIRHYWNVVSDIEVTLVKRDVSE